MILYLVRHLPTQNNLDGVYMGRSLDVPIISSNTLPFIRRVIKILENGHPESGKIFTSPARRCIETADILSNLFGIKEKVEIHESLHETNYGSFEGKNAAEIKLAEPVIFQMWMEKPSHVCFPGGESFYQVMNRATDALKQIISVNEDAQLVFIVTHVDVIKMIVCWILGISIDDKLMFRIDNGSFTCLETTGEKNNLKKIKVKSLNVT